MVEMSSSSHLAMKVSKTRAKIGVSEIGLSWSKEEMFLSFGIGTTVAVFHIFGKIPSEAPVFYTSIESILRNISLRSIMVVSTKLLYAQALTL